MKDLVLLLIHKLTKIFISYFIYYFLCSYIIMEIQIHNDDFCIYQYIKENYIGLLLFVFAFFIIYIVEHITQLNVFIYSMPPISTVTKQLKPKKTNKK